MQICLKRPITNMSHLDIWSSIIMSLVTTSSMSWKRITTWSLSSGLLASCKFQKHRLGLLIIIVVSALCSRKDVEYYQVFYKLHKVIIEERKSTHFVFTYQITFVYVFVNFREYEIDHPEKLSWTHQQNGQSY